MSALESSFCRSGPWRGFAQRVVLRPGGAFVGYDLTGTALARLVHRVDGSPHLLLSARDLRECLISAGFADVDVEERFAAYVMRFRARKPGTSAAA